MIRGQIRKKEEKKKRRKEEKRKRGKEEKRKRGKEEKNVFIPKKCTYSRTKPIWRLKQHFQK